jgi:hypothetical protein
MFPAHDEVALGGIMPVLAEVAAPELQFDVDLDITTLVLLLRPTVRESDPHGLNKKAQLMCNHPEEKDHPLFVDGLVAQPTKVNRRAE